MASKWAISAAHEIYQRMDEIEGEAFESAAAAQDSDEGEFRAVEIIAEVIDKHHSKQEATNGEG